MDQSVLTVIAADTRDGLQARTSSGWRRVLPGACSEALSIWLFGGSHYPCNRAMLMSECRRAPYVICCAARSTMPSATPAPLSRANLT